jgi:hypothetical protein
MLITARQASGILQERAGVGRQQSRRILHAGLAGEATAGPACLLYVEARVTSLAERAQADQAELLSVSPGGVFVLRLGRGREISTALTWEEAVAALEVQSDLGLMMRLHVRSYLAAFGRLPFVATVCGFPVLTADLVSFDAVVDDRVALGLEKAGSWRGLLEGRRLSTSPGPPWLLLGHQPYLGRAEAARERGEPVGAARSTTWSRWA